MSTQDPNDNGYEQFRAALDELERVQAPASAAAAPGLGAAGENPVERFCEFWPTVRGILDIVVRLPFIPGRVKDIIRRFIPIADAVCRS